MSKYACVFKFKKGIDQTCIRKYKNGEPDEVMQFLKEFVKDNVDSLGKVSVDFIIQANDDDSVGYEIIDGDNIHDKYLYTILLDDEIIKEEDLFSGTTNVHTV